MATPGRNDHETISEIDTGTPATAVHKALDLPHLLSTLPKPVKEMLPKPAEIYKALRHPQSKYTSGHRQVFHTWMEALLIGYIIDGQRGGRNAAIHILADETFHTKESKQLLKLLKKPK